MPTSRGAVDSESDIGFRIDQNFIAFERQLDGRDKRRLEVAKLDQKRIGIGPPRGSCRRRTARPIPRRRSLHPGARAVDRLFLAVQSRNDSNRVGGLIANESESFQL